MKIIQSDLICVYCKIYENKEGDKIDCSPCHNYDKFKGKKVYIDIENLYIENEKLKEVLKWYADKDNYYYTEKLGYCRGSEICDNNGQKARAVLKEIE